MLLHCIDTDEKIEADIAEVNISRDGPNVVLSLIRDAKRYEITIPLTDLIQMEQDSKRGRTHFQSKGGIKVDPIH